MKKRLLILALLIGSCYVIIAQPANNDCGGALTITPGATCNTTSGTVAGATQSIAATVGTADDDVWYQFTAAATTQIITVVSAGATFNPVIQVYSGICPTLTPINSPYNSASTITEKAIVTGLTAGVIYYYRVYSFSGTVTTTPTFTTCIVTPPVNDECLGAIDITPGTTCSPSNTIDGTFATPNLTTITACGTAAMANDDVWFSFTAAATSEFINITPSASYNPVIQVFSGSCASLTSIKCDDNTAAAGVATSTTVTGLTAGTQYFYRVYDAGSTNPATMTFTTCIVNPVANDECLGAYTVTPGSTCSPVSGNGTLATQSLSACTGSGANDDVWFTFQAQTENEFINVTASTGYNPVVQVFSGTCASLSTLQCDNNSYPVSGTGSAAVSGLTAGNKYYYRVFDYSSTNPANMTFTTCIVNSAANDECNGAYTVTPGTVCSPIDGTALSTTESLTGCAGTAEDDVWYTFVAAAPSQFINVTPSSGYNPVIQVFSGNCASLTSIKCSNNTSANDGVATSTTVTGLTTGNTYFYRIYDYDATAPTTPTFSTCVTNPVENDECDGAILLDVTDACDFHDFSNSAATQSATTPCGTPYNDVWFKAVVPASGHIAIFADLSGITAGGIALYSSCGAASALACEYSASISTPSIDYTGLTPGQTVYIRLWSASATVSGDFRICVSSPPPCASNPAAGDLCSTATPICNLNGFCGNTSATYGADTPGNLSSTFPSGMSIENNSWLSFNASSTTASFTVYVSNCAQSYGVQIGVYQASSCATFTLHSTVWNPGSQENTVIYATNLVVGQTYLIMIDGNSGDVCDYEIAASSGVMTVDAGENTTVCSGTPVTLSATGPGGGAVYTWSSRTSVGGALTILGTTNPTTVTPTVTTTYIVSVAGGTLCSGIKDSLVVTVNSCGCTPPAVNAGLDGVVTCSTPSMQIGSTGLANVTYLWSSNPSSTIPNSNTAQPTVSPTITTTYTVTATGASSNCTAIDQVVVTVNKTAPTITFSTPAVLTCTNLSSSITATGGNSYAWSSSAGGSTISTSNPLTTNTAGTYYVTATGTNGCTSVSNKTVTSNTTAPTVTISDPVVITCSTTSASMTATGGGTYSWSGGSATTSATNTFSTAGNYSITVTDAVNGCTTISSKAVTSNLTAPTVTISDPSVITCLAPSTSMTATGGGTYSWSGGSAATSATNTFTSAGNYTVTVTDAVNGCTTISSKAVTSNLTTPTITISDPVVLTCSTTGTSMTATGGGSYLWSGGSAITSATNTFTSAGNYSVTVTDAVNGCASISSKAVTSNTTPPTVTITTPAVLTCATTSVSMTASGGGTYLWSSGSATTAATNTFTSAGNYTVTVTDAVNGCTSVSSKAITSNTTAPTVTITDPAVLTCITLSASMTASGGGTYAWSGGSAASSATNTFTSAGNYTVTVTDAVNGCTASSSKIVTSNTTLPTPSAGGDVAICNGANAILTASGGGTYQWTSGNNTNPITVSPTTTTNYVVTATNTANGCTAIDDVTVTVNNNPVVTISVPNTTICKNQNTTLTANGGTSWSWSNGGSSSTISVSPAVNSSYQVTATDNNGCKATDDISLTISVVNASATSTAVCLGQQATITASGGTTFKWSTSETSAQISVNPNTTTTYDVIVGNSIGCSDTATSTVTVNSLPVLDLGNDLTICSGSSITLSAVANNWQYHWGNSQTGQSITVSPNNTTTYVLNVTDANSCTASDNIVVIVNQTPVAYAGPDQSICDGDSAILNASGGVSYLWNNPIDLSSIVISNPIANPVQTSTYTVTVSANGCPSVDEVVIHVFPIPVADAGIDQSICFGKYAQLSAVGGTNYHWSNAINSDAITVNPTINTTYSVTVSANGCSSTDEVIVTVISLPVVSFASDIISGCEPLSVNFSDSTLPTPLTYLWDFGDGTFSNLSNPNHLYTSDGVYDVKLIVKNNEGCESSYNHNNMISVYPQPNVDFDWTPDMGDVFDGKITFHSISNGGVADYLWNFGDTSSISNISIDENPIHKYVYAGYYNISLVGTTQYGCSDSAYHTLRIKDLTTFYIPNSFTPNGNDLNETFQPIFLNMEFDSYEFSILTRWGEKIFSTNNPDEGWNGSVNGNSNNIKQDVYVWIVKFKEKEGLSIQKIGNVTLLR